MFRVNGGYAHYTAQQGLGNSAGTRTDNAWTVSGMSLLPTPENEFALGFNDSKGKHAGFNGGGNILNPFGSTAGVTTVAADGSKKALFASWMYHVDRQLDVYLVGDHFKVDGGWVLGDAQGNGNHFGAGQAYSNETEVGRRRALQVLMRSRGARGKLPPCVLDSAVAKGGRDSGQLLAVDEPQSRLSVEPIRVNSTLPPSAFCGASERWPGRGRCRSVASRGCGRMVRRPARAAPVGMPGPVSSIASSANSSSITTLTSTQPPGRCVANRIVDGIAYQREGMQCESPRTSA